MPTLLLHGDDDQIVPYQDASVRFAGFLKNATIKIYPGYSHGMLITPAWVLNEDLLAFVKWPPPNGFTLGVIALLVHEEAPRLHEAKL